VTDEQVVSQLNKRELAALHILATGGFGNAEIAEIFRTTEQVIKNRFRHAYAVTGVETRARMMLFVQHHAGLQAAAAAAWQEYAGTGK
jgi:DNA-binding CsgD family transcriptional regulator